MTAYSGEMTAYSGEMTAYSRPSRGEPRLILARGAET
jgi:hypothetical protein